MTFAGLLGTALDESTFLREYWGAKWLHIRGAQDRFRSLISWQDVNDILALSQRLQPDTVTLWKSAKSVPREAYTKSKLTLKKRAVATEVQAELLTAELRNGATLTINHIDELHSPLTSLARDLEGVFDVGARINLYASWGTANGFPRHFDEHDAFIVQVEGRKHWQIWQPTIEHPLVFTGLEAAPQERALWDGPIDPGEVLYLPRGYWHLATPCGEPSLHLTIGIRPITGADFLRWAADRLYMSVDVRGDVPRFGHVEQATKEYAARLRFALMEWVSETGVAEFLRHVKANAPLRPCFGLPWSAAPDLLPPFPSGTITLVPAFSPDLRIPHPDGDISLSIAGKTFTWDRLTLPLFEYLLQHKTSSVAAFSERFSGSWDEDQIRSFLIGTITSGLVVVRD